MIEKSSTVLTYCHSSTLAKSIALKREPRDELAMLTRTVLIALKILECRNHAGLHEGGRMSLRLTRFSAECRRSLNAGTLTTIGVSTTSEIR